MNEQTFHGTLVKKKEGIYTLYVIQKDNLEYIMCTKLPNWGIYNLNEGDSGFWTIIDAKAGEQYFDRNTNTYNTLRFTNLYFKEFIKDLKKLDDIVL